MKILKRFSVLTVLFLSNCAMGYNALFYNNSNGALTFLRPDLSEVRIENGNSALVNVELDEGNVVTRVRLDMNLEVDWKTRIDLSWTYAFRLPVTAELPAEFLGTYRIPAFGSLDKFTILAVDPADPSKLLGPVSKDRVSLQQGEVHKACAVM